jgi:hypothetical protein
MKIRLSYILILVICGGSAAELASKIYHALVHMAAGL